MVDLRKIIDNTLVPHTAFQEATRRIEQCFQYSADSSEPVCIALIGESRTGKSRALEEFYMTHQQSRNDQGLTMPILRVRTPSKPTVKSLAELMLKAVGDPKFSTGTENVKTTRLQTMMRKTSVQMIMIDEFQHFFDKGSHKVMHHVADWLKILVDDAVRALVVAGLPTCQAVLLQNEQLAGRFLSPIFMPRFDWRNDAHREEFIGILGAFQEALEAHFDLPALDSPDMAFRCFCGTGGLMGYLTKFLRQLVWDALDRGSRTIELADLLTAHDESVWVKAGPHALPSPFSRDFSTVPNDDLLNRIQLIGAPLEELPPKRRRTVIQPASTQSVLSAV